MFNQFKRHKVNFITNFELTKGHHSYKYLFLCPAKAKKEKEKILHRLTFIHIFSVDNSRLNYINLNLQFFSRSLNYSLLCIVVYLNI